VVLKRPVGSDGAFGEHAELPKNLGQDGPKKSAPKPAGRKAKETSASPDKAADRKASQAYERERQRRKREEAREEAARQKKRESRQQAVDRAQAFLDEAEQGHGQRKAALRAEMEAIEEKLKAENDAWDKKERRLNAALRARARRWIARQIFDHVAWRSVIRVSSDGRPRRSAKPGHTGCRCSRKASFLRPDTFPRRIRCWRARPH
jgi:hypothetical protein